MGPEMKSLLERALSHARADYCEIRVEQSRQTGVSLRGRDNRHVTSELTAGGNVRALVGGGWGFVSFNRLDDLPRKVEEACAHAAVLGARLGRQIRLAPVTPVQADVAGVFRSDPTALPLAQRVALLTGYNELMLAQPEVASTSVTYFDKRTELLFANTEGSMISQDKLDIGLRMAAMAARGTVSTQASVSTGSNTDYGVTQGLEGRLLEAAASAKAMLDAPVVKGGEYTVVLDPEMAGIFVHEAFGHLSEADQLSENEKIRELLKIGTRYGPADLHVYDSGIEGGNRGEAAYDDEGVPMQRTDLIQGGVVAGHLHSRETASLMGEAPTGNARAISYRFPPIVRMRTTCIGPGRYSLAEMLRGVDRGIYVRGAYGGQTNGEMFTFMAERANLIRGGEIAEPVRDVNLSGNVFATLDAIDMIGSDFVISNMAGGCGKGMQSPLATADGAPHIRIRNVVVGGEGA